MDDRAKSDLPYGHFGRGTYVSDNATWSFERKLGFPRATKLFGASSVPKESVPTVVPGSIVTGRGPPSKQQARQITELVRTNPQLQQSQYVISQFLKVSELAQRSYKHHDPIRGQLLAFASIRSEIRHHSVAVAALVSGVTGESLYLRRVQTQKRGWGDNEGSRLEVPSLSGEGAVWCSPDGPIQQVCFTPHVERADVFLAVRLLTKTNIFSISLDKFDPREPGDSSIAPKLLYSLSMDRTGSQPHVDVAFNPWFNQQLGVVDVAGKWTVVEFRSTRMNRIVRSWSSSAHATPTEDSRVHDGWVRFSWVGSLDTVVTCTRRKLTVFSIATETPVVVGHLDLGLHDNTTWILDFAMVPGQTNRCFLLTTTHLLIIRVVSNSPSDVTTRIDFKIRHFKNPEDLSLRLTICIGEADLGLLLYSSFSSTALQYKVRLAELGDVECEDPTEVSLPSAQGVSPKTEAIMFLHMKPVSVLRSANPRDKMPEEAKSARVFQLIAIHSDYSLTESLLAQPQRKDKHWPQTDRATPFWASRLKTTSSKVSKESFVVHDASMDNSDAELQQVEPLSRRARVHTSLKKTSKRPMSLQIVTNKLLDNQGRFKTMIDVVSEMANIFSIKSPYSPEPLWTLSSLVDAEVEVGNVDHESDLLEGALSQNRHRTTDGDTIEDDGAYGENHLGYGRSTVTMPKSTQLDRLLSKATLYSVYGDLLKNWVGSLSPLIPGRVRIARERLVRQIAGDIILASHALWVEEVTNFNIKQERADHSAQTWELPVRSSDSEPRSTSSQQQAAGIRGTSTHVLLTPSPTATPSITTASSHPSSFAAPELLRLSKYTTFDKPSPSVPPRSISKVLSHWSVGSDIASYDWLTTSRALPQDDEGDDGEMTEKERRRMHRRAERHIKRERREAAASQAQQLASSQAASVFSASQPSGVKVQSQSHAMAGSSQGTSQEVLAASQVMPGRFGGRPQKKRRKQGF